MFKHKNLPKNYKSKLCIVLTRQLSPNTSTYLYTLMGTLALCVRCVITTDGPEGTVSTQGALTHL